MQGVPKLYLEESLDKADKDLRDRLYNPLPEGSTEEGMREFVGWVQGQQTLDFYQKTVNVSGPAFELTDSVNITLLAAYTYKE